MQWSNELSAKIVLHASTKLNGRVTIRQSIQNIVPQKKEQINAGNKYTEWKPPHLNMRAWLMNNLQETSKKNLRSVVVAPVQAAQFMYTIVACGFTALDHHASRQ